MKKFYLMFIVAFLANAGCASERLYVKVTDDNGAPVSNATVRVSFSTSNVLFGGGNSSRAKVDYADACTDENGNAIVKFNCKTAAFSWYVEAKGYYRSNSQREQFKFDEIIMPPGVVKVMLSEHEKHREVKLYRIKNPQSMVVHKKDKRVKSPVKNGRYGFDLEAFDWLPPHGTGKVADFYYVRDRPDETNLTVKAKLGHSRFFLFKNGDARYPRLGDVVGRIEFENKCGAYIEKKTGNESFSSLYEADLKKEFKSSFPITIVGNGGYETWLQESSVIGDDNYMVIKSRVKCDEDGNIVSCNYSKIHGRFALTYAAIAEEIIFNPTPNDTNLEAKR